MEFFAQGLATKHRAVARFNFVYMEQGRKSPGSAKTSETTYSEVVEQLRATLSPRQTFVGGKSYGGRMASHIAASGTVVDGLVFLGYPLHAPGRPDKMRDEHLYKIESPMLFVEGTRDPFAPLDTIRKVIKKIGRSAELVVVEDGDHSLKVPKSSGRSTEQAWADAIAAIEKWLGG
jgi:predicted alpha/beta-hydrolase family hydrolase